MVASSGQSYSYSVGRGRSRGIGCRARVAAGHDLETLDSVLFLAAFWARLMRSPRGCEERESTSADRQHSQQTGLCCAELCGCRAVLWGFESVTAGCLTGTAIGDLDVPVRCGSWGGGVGVAETQVRPWWCIQLARRRYRYLVPVLCLCLCLCLAMAVEPEGPERTAHSADPSPDTRLQSSEELVAHRRAGHRLEPPVVSASTDQTVISRVQVLARGLVLCSTRS